MSLPAFVRRASAAAIALLCGVGLLTGGRVVSGAVAAIPAANGQVVHDAVGSWQQTPAAVGIAPPNAAYVTAGVTFQQATADEVHVIDDVTLTTAPGSSPAVIGPLTTVGNRIIDGLGNTVVLRG